MDCKLSPQSRLSEEQNLQASILYNVLCTLDSLVQLCEVRPIYYVHGNSCHLIQSIEGRFIIIFLKDLSN